MEIKELVSFFLMVCLFWIPAKGKAGEKPYLPSVLRIRILQSHHPESVQISCNHGRVFFPDGLSDLNQPLKAVSSGRKIHSDIRGADENFSTLRIEGQRIQISFGKSIFRTYEGVLDIYSENDELILVNETSLESYVHSAALSETEELLRKDDSGAEGWSHELLSAMEICIRSYITSNLKRHSDSRYSFCDLTHCVHYAGISNETKSTTSGLILFDEKNAVNAFFHSTCGGILSHPDIYWHGEKGKAFRYGEDRKDGNILCERSPHFSWSFFLSRAKLNQIFNLDIESISLRKREGRVSSIEVRTLQSEKTVPVSVFMSAAGRVAGWNSIKSNNFDILNIGDGYRFEGHGLGHGIGLCQYGAMALAKKGLTCNQILKYYYPGAEVVKGRVE